MASGKTRALWDLTRGKRGMFLAALIALIIGTLLMYLSPQIVRVAIDEILDRKQQVTGGFQRVSPLSVKQLPVITWTLASIDAKGHPYRALILAGCAVVLVTLLGGICMYFRGRWTALASESIIRSLRLRLYDHLQHLPVSYHDKAQTGAQVEGCTSGVDTVRMVYKAE